MLNEPTAAVAGDNLPFVKQRLTSLHQSLLAILQEGIWGILWPVPAPSIILPYRRISAPACNVMIAPTGNPRDMLANKPRIWASPQTQPRWKSVN